MSYILVTGSNGFVGSKLVDQLISKGFKVLGLSTGLNKREINENFKFVQTDITNQQAVEKVFIDNNISFVIHLAAIAHVKNRKNLNWNVYYRNNTLASKTIFHNAIKHGSKIFFASSVDVYGNKKEFPLEETLSLKPISDYAKSKFLAEKMLTEITSNKSIDFVIARFAPIYDKDFMKDINKRIYFKYPNIAFSIGSGQNFHFISVNNVVDFIMEWIINSNEFSGVVNVCDETLINSNQFIALEKSFGRSKYVLKLPKQLFVIPKYVLELMQKIFKKNRFIKKQYININKLISPANYSTSRMLGLFKPKWNLEKTIYKNIL